MKKWKVILNGKEMPKLEVNIEDLVIEDNRIGFEAPAIKHLNKSSWADMGYPENYAFGEIVGGPYKVNINFDKKIIDIKGDYNKLKWGPSKSKPKLPEK